MATALFMLTVLAMPSMARDFNAPYTGKNLSYVNFPIGGMGSGMFCLEGTGAITQLSVEHEMDFFNTPYCYAAITVKGKDGKNTARVLEGPLAQWKYFGIKGAANGLGSTTFGLPRFRKASFLDRFPFATIDLSDGDIPLGVKITGWSPFTPGDPDSSGLPVGALEYTFTNTTNQTQSAIFSFNSQSFFDRKGGSIGSIPDGFVIYRKKGKDRDKSSAFAFFVKGEKDVTVDHCWFRGGWFDKNTVTWNNVEKGTIPDNPPVESDAQGASLAVPFMLKPGETKTIRLLEAWYVPTSKVRSGKPSKTRKCECADGKCEVKVPKTYVPWYATQFKSIYDVANNWRNRYDELRKRSEVFRDAFYDSTLPPEVLEAVAANLAILKSPTVMRQHDGRLWCWEGCCDGRGCCAGSCTHVWNYAQAICHLFPSMERTLRRTEFNESQEPSGHQTFRSNLP
ncbi:MAG: GH116 family glycosyl-hydrolase, partial [Planctomycetia bacterium]